MRSSGYHGGVVIHEYTNKMLQQGKGFVNPGPCFGDRDKGCMKKIQAELQENTTYNI